MEEIDHFPPNKLLLSIEEFILANFSILNFFLIFFTKNGAKVPKKCGEALIFLAYKVHVKCKSVQIILYDFSTSGFLYSMTNLA